MGLPATVTRPGSHWHWHVPAPAALQWPRCAHRTDGPRPAHEAAGNSPATVTRAARAWSRCPRLPVVRVESNLEVTVLYHGASTTSSMPAPAYGRVPPAGGHWQPRPAGPPSRQPGPGRATAGGGLSPSASEVPNPGPSPSRPRRRRGQRRRVTGTGTSPRNHGGIPKLPVAFRVRHWQAAALLNKYYQGLGLCSRCGTRTGRIQVRTGAYIIAPPQP
jgi:hypothetical protein